MSQLNALALRVSRMEPQQAAAMMGEESEATIAAVLSLLPPAKAIALLPRFEAARRSAILSAATAEQRRQWLHNQEYSKGTVGELMEPAVALFPPSRTVFEAVQQLRDMVRQAFITYVYVVDTDRRLIGVVVMRELLLAQPAQALADIMIEHPFFLKATQSVTDVIPLVHTRHFPEYPVCAEGGVIVGIVRGYALFHQQMLEVSAQPSKMVGIDREERIQTGPWRSVHLRHPWLQFNLVSSFLAAGVVGFYEDTVAQFLAVAAFVPVMVGQSASTGAQALAVALRGLTLGEFKHEDWQALIVKEARVGLVNGALVGATAALAMFVYASLQHQARAASLAIVMLLAMIISTLLSSVVGAAMPLAMKRWGCDPAVASTILVGGLTRIVSIASFLALTHWILL